jgi:uncharacterized protein (DUF2267 family)
MTHEEFVGQVQHRAHLSSRGAAEKAIRAVFETLAERTEHGAAAHVAAQLPSELGRFLAEKREFHRLSLLQFFQRVSELEGPGTDIADAAYHSRVVIEVLEEGVAEGALHKIRAGLPSDFDPLFSAGSHGRLRPQEGPEHQQG